MRRKGSKTGGHMKEVTTTRLGKWMIEEDAITAVEMTETAVGMTETAVGMTETEGAGEIAAETGKDDLVVAVTAGIVVGELDRNLVAFRLYCRLN